MSVSDIFKLALEIFKLAPRYLVSITAIAAIFLFAPENTLKAIGGFEFAKSYRQWIGIAFIGSGVLFLVDRCIAIFGWIRHGVAMQKHTKAMLKRLHSLREDEKQILRFYVAKQTKTNVLRIEDGIVQGLESTGIIYRATGIGHVLHGFAYNIDDRVWEYLNKHQRLLNGTTNSYRTDGPEAENRLGCGPNL
jgi:hypothetical protein